MTIGLIFLIISLLLIAYAYFSYNNAAKSLAPVKQEDLVSYYLDLTYNLLPVPFWSALLGIALFLVALVIILFHLPVVF